MRLIPAIDLRGGYVVRLEQGRFDRERMYRNNPAELAASYADAGADWLHVVDLDGARDGSSAQHAAIGAIAGTVSAHIQVGGGIRDADGIDRLFDAGVARVVIGSRAVTHADETRAWLGRYGAGRVVLALDVSLDDGAPRLRTHGWKNTSEQTLWDAVGFFSAAGLRHVLCTDVARDGMLQGPNVALYRDCNERFPRIDWQASGGVSGVEDLHSLCATGANGAIVGRALLDGRLAIGEAGPFLQNA